MATVDDQMLILEVLLTTGETQVHTYPIAPYGDRASVNRAVDMIQEILEEVRKLLSGEVKALKYPSIAYNPAHVIRVKIDGEKAADILKQVPVEKRTLGFPL